MAIAVNYSQVFGGTVAKATLLNAAAATGDGEWVDVSGLRTATIHSILTGTATALIRGSNEPTRPANDTHGFALMTHTATGGGLIDIPCNWVKAYVSSFTSGTVTVYFYGMS